MDVIIDLIVNIPTLSVLLISIFVLIVELTVKYSVDIDDVFKLDVLKIVILLVLALIILIFIAIMYKKN